LRCHGITFVRTTRGGTAHAERKTQHLGHFGDDIGISNLSCYSDGMMGYRTPNIDRIASEGMRFTDSYGEQSCTAGRTAFISGQSVYRTGMSKVGVPGVDIGWAAEDPTIAELLKPLGYATGQFGKNHFGDLNKHLPTVHGFDEFFGNLYHLNAEEEHEQFDYPHKDQFPKLYETALPRGMLDCKASDEVSTEPDDDKFGPVGKQTIEDTGPLTAAGAQAVQPAHRPLRIRRHHLEYVLRLVHAARLLRLLCDRDGVAVPRHVQGVSAAARAGQLQHRPDRPEAQRLPSVRLIFQTTRVRPQRKKEFVHA
jgi:hypothetical protein